MSMFLWEGKIMLMKVFSVRDMKTEAFLQPYFSPTVGSALRAFGDACGKSDSPFYLHPNDYVLFEIGSYDDGTGSLDKLITVKMIACAADFVEKMRPKIDLKDMPEGVIDGVKVVPNHGS